MPNQPEQNQLKPGEPSPMLLQVLQLMVDVMAATTTEEMLTLFGQLHYGPGDSRAFQEGRYLAEHARLRNQALRQGQPDIARAFAELILSKVTKALGVPNITVSSDIGFVPWK